MPLDQMNWTQIAGNDADEQALDGAICTDPATDLLIRARGLLERGWCRGAHARNLIGFKVSPYSRHATAWCASGALYAAALIASDLDRRRANIRLIAAIEGEYLTDFNDRQRTVEPVLAAFDRAIAAGGR
jgi:hypothetical protein